MAKLDSISNERIQEIIQYYYKFGLKQAAEDFQIKEETILRYIRHAKNKLKMDVEKNKTLVKLSEKFTEKELKEILYGSLIAPEKNRATINFEGEEFIFGYITDTHVGSKFFKDHYLQAYFEQADKYNVQCTFHTGDLTEGMSHRPDHIYSLTHIGYDAQKEKTIELFKPYKKPLYIIDGNHDRWYIKSNGALIVKDIAREFDNWIYLGHDNAIVTVNGTNIELHHGEDGNSYATSYRVQKIIEAMRGGEKPNILLTGHTHKMIYMFERNIQAISGGALCWQTDWMKAKRIVSHTGFWIVKCCISKNRVMWIEPKWFSIYKKD